MIPTCSRNAVASAARAFNPPAGAPPSGALTLERPSGYAAAGADAAGESQPASVSDKRRWRMPRRHGWWVMVMLLASVAGCDTVDRLLSPNKVTVSMVNNGDYPVDVRFYISDDQNVVEDLLTSFGNEVNYRVEAGSTVDFTRDCDNLQAIIIKNAALDVVGDIGPQKSTEVLRDGDDFGCGDQITFTFDHSDLILDFDIAVAVN
jgi:hypothetical protein